MFSLFSPGKGFFTSLLFSLQEFQRNLLVYSLLSFLSLVFKGCLNMIIFSVPHRSLRQILLSLPPILDMLFLLLFVILIFAMLGKLMIMRVIVLLFIQNISKLIVCLHLWCSCLQIKCAFSPAGTIRFFLWKSVSHLSSAFSSFCVFRDSNFFRKELFNYQLKNAKPPFRQTSMTVFCRSFHVIWWPAKLRLQNWN